MLRCALVAVLFVISPAARACSVIPSYRVPTNLELSKAAQSIVLAKVLSGTPAREGGMDSYQITIQPLANLKGDLPPSPLVLEGMMLAPDRMATLSNPYEFEGAHPLSYIGGCIRDMFPVGTTALFFLEKQDGKWRPAGGPFSRWAEDVADQNSPWAVLAALYVRASGLPQSEGKALLTSERERFAAKPDDPVARLMALDIARQLAGSNKPWNSLMSLGAGPSGSDQEAMADAAADAVLAAVKAEKAAKRRKH